MEPAMSPFEIADDAAPDRVLASLLVLFSLCLTEGACAGRAKAVFERLRWLARQPGVDDAVRQACWDASLRWVRWQVREAEAMNEFLGPLVPMPTDARRH
jgi:hypothetical protein